VQITFSHKKQAGNQQGTGTCAATRSWETFANLNHKKAVQALQHK